ncbi:MAG: glycosyltransferase [Planctomycetota bacterium]
MPRKPHLLFAGGGSLGCIYPALSIARRVQTTRPDIGVTVVGAGRAIERHTVTGAGFRYAATPRGESPRTPLEYVSSAARNAAGWGAAMWLLREVDASLVVSLGGHASGPVVRAARASGVPYLVLEQHAEPEPATRALLDAAEAVCVADDAVLSHLPVTATVHATGGVARPCFEDAHARGWLPAGRDDRCRPRRLVVMGGVGGAASLNESTPAAVARLGSIADGWQVVHQSGAGCLTETQACYDAAGIDAIVVSYIDELADLARHADLIICRPGGSTLADLRLAGLPPVLAPDCRRRDTLHWANARQASTREGCPIVDERRGDLPASLANALRPLMSDAGLRRALATRTAAHATPDASQLVAEVCLEALGAADSTTPPADRSATHLPAATRPARVPARAA